MFLGFIQFCQIPKLWPLFFLVCNCLVHLCPLFHFKQFRISLLQVHFLYTAYYMTFLPNSDAVSSSQHYLVPTPPRGISQNPLLHMVLGKWQPRRGSYRNLRDRNEREDILLLRQLQLDLWAWEKFLTTLKLLASPLWLAIIGGEFSDSQEKQQLQFKNDPLLYLRLRCQCWLLWLAGDTLTFSRSFPDLCSYTSSNRYLRPDSTLKQLDLNT